MKIAVLLKQVPERDAPVRVRSDARWFDEDNLNWTPNESDGYALEEALRLKEEAGGAGEVVAVCAGPERVASTLRDALAKGADRALRVDFEELERLDTLQLSGLLAEALRAEAPDLVLTGLQSDDLGLGQTGVVVAELLGVAHATLITRIERVEDGLRVTRELEDGWSQTVEMPLPALLSVQSGPNRPRCATLMGIKRSRTRELKTVRAEGGPGRPSTVLERVVAPERGKQTVMLTGSPAEIAEQLADRLRFDVGVL